MIEHENILKKQDYFTNNASFQKWQEGFLGFYYVQRENITLSRLKKHLK